MSRCALLDENFGRLPVKVSHAIVLRLLGKLSPRIYGYLRRGKVGVAARRALDVFVPAGSDVVADVRGGPLKGTRLRLDPRKQKEMLIGNYESGVQQALQHYAGKGDVVFDVGAHLGFFSLLASKVVGEEGRVVALEPDPYMSERLSSNLTLNSKTNVTWKKAAVGEKETEMTFAPGKGAGIGRLSEEGSMTVQVVSIDELAREFGPPRVMKIDVEGGELDVLAGATAVLREHHPTLIIEAHGEINERIAAEMLEEYDYHIGFINDVSGRRHLLATAPE